MDLLKQLKLTKVSDAVASATGAVNSASVDMSNSEGVIFLTSFGTAADGNWMNAATGASTTAFVDLEGTKVSSTAATEDFGLDIHKPRKRYLRAELNRGTASTVDNIWALQYGVRSAPVTNTSSGTLVVETHISPTTGTA